MTRDAIATPRPNLLLLFAGKFASELGTGVFFIAISLFALSTKDSGIGDFSLLLIANALPSLITAPVAGMFIDRYQKKSILVLSDFSQSAIFALLFLSFLLKRTDLSLVVIASFLNGLLKAFNGPTVKAMLPLLAPPAKLQKVNSIEAIIRSSTNLIGIFAGGIIVAFFGVIGCFLVNAITFFVAALCDSLLRIENAPSAPQPRNLRSTLEDIRYGVRSAFATRELSLVFFFTFILTFFLMPSGYLLFPVVLRSVFHFNESLFATVQSGFPAGIILGSLLLVLSARNTLAPPTRYFIGAALGMSLILSSWAALIHLDSHATLFNAASLGISVMIMGVINVLMAVKATTYIQRTVDARVLGKVLSMQELAYTAVIPFGLVVFSVGMRAIGTANDPRSLKYVFLSLAAIVPLLFLAVLVLTRGRAVARQSADGDGDLEIDGQEP